MLSLKAAQVCVGQLSVCAQFTAAQVCLCLLSICAQFTAAQVCVGQLSICAQFYGCSSLLRQLFICAALQLLKSVGQLSICCQSYSCSSLWDSCPSVVSITAAQVCGTAVHLLSVLQQLKFEAVGHLCGLTAAQVCSG